MPSSAAGLIQIPQSSTQRKTSTPRDEKTKMDSTGKRTGKNSHSGEITFSRFKLQSKLDSESLSYITEDIRIATLQRKLVRETNPSIAFGIALQISEVILYHENRGYIYRSSEVICDAIKEVLLGSKSSGGSSVVNHGDAIKAESAKAMGHVAYVLSDRINSGKFAIYNGAFWPE